ncbi:hypothetical protein AB4J90_12555 [Geobacillus thermodenitrificans]|uniref:hypothetical protein n=1 Tax=Geobacillus thermodenitrificans TaxID=33940 RepID=UPI001E5B7AEC|nr:hypothetical protein [Geobacillus thermodenitrificans]
MQKGKIPSVHDVAAVSSIIATAILLVLGGTVQHTRQDMWMSPFWTSLIGFLTVHLSVQLHCLYPKKMPIEYSADILGKCSEN